MIPHAEHEFQKAFLEDFLTLMENVLNNNDNKLILINHTILIGFLLLIATKFYYKNYLKLVYLNIFLVFTILIYNLCKNLN